MCADEYRPPRDQSASLADSRHNRHQASDSLPSALCRWPVTSRASAQRSSVPRSLRNAPARRRSSWPWPAATPDARVASAVYRPWLIAAVSARTADVCSSKASRPPELRPQASSHGCTAAAGLAPASPPAASPAAQAAPRRGFSTADNQLARWVLGLPGLAASQQVASRRAASPAYSGSRGRISSGRRPPTRACRSWKGCDRSQLFPREQRAGTRRQGQGTKARERAAT
jgi:hypothetical protein